VFTICHHVTKMAVPKVRVELLRADAFFCAWRSVLPLTGFLSDCA
jgi:hypothetical protein